MPKAKLIPKNRILSVTIKRMVDDSPDTSWLGEYSDTRTSEFSIDRAHAEDCTSVSPEAQRTKETLEHAQQTVGDLHNAILAQYNGTLANEKLDTEREALDDAYDLLGNLSEEVTECDCGTGGHQNRNEYRYFNPSGNYKGDTPENIRKYTRQDYERMEDLNNGGWCFIRIRAEARVILPQTSYHMSDGSIIYLTQTLSSGGLWGIESDSGKDYLAEVEQEQLSELRDVLLSFGFSRRAIATAFKNVEHKDE